MYAAAAAAVKQSERVAAVRAAMRLADEGGGERVRSGMWTGADFERAVAARPRAAAQYAHMETDRALAAAGRLAGYCDWAWNRDTALLAGNGVVEGPDAAGPALRLDAVRAVSRKCAVAVDAEFDVVVCGGRVARATNLWVLCAAEPRSAEALDECERTIEALMEDGADAFRSFSSGLPTPLEMYAASRVRPGSAAVVRYAVVQRALYGNARLGVDAAAVARVAGAFAAAAAADGGRERAPEARALVVDWLAEHARVRPALAAARPTQSAAAVGAAALAHLAAVRDALDHGDGAGERGATAAELERALADLPPGAVAEIGRALAESQAARDAAFAVMVSPRRAGGGGAPAPAPRRFPLAEPAAVALFFTAVGLDAAHTVFRVDPPERPAAAQTRGVDSGGRINTTALGSACTYLPLPSQRAAVDSTIAQLVAAGASASGQTAWLSGRGKPGSALNAYVLSRRDVLLAAPGEALAALLSGARAAAVVQAAAYARAGDLPASSPARALFAERFAAFSSAEAAELAAVCARRPDGPRLRRQLGSLVP